MFSSWSNRYQISPPMMENSRSSEDETVLDLCVRNQTEKKTKIKQERETNCVVENYHSELSSDSDGKSPILLQQQLLIRPVLPCTDPDRIDSIGILHDRIYAPDVNRNSVSPPFLALTPTLTTATTKGGKPTRPFKAYPKDPLTLVPGEGLLGDSNERYAEFRRKILQNHHSGTGGGSAGNKNMKRPVQSTSPNQMPSSSGDAKDQAYWERRKKNNEAAKRSRDARRAKEDEIAIRAAFLEQENIQLKYQFANLTNERNQLKYENSALKEEANRLRQMLYSS